DATCSITSSVSARNPGILCWPRCFRCNAIEESIIHALFHSQLLGLESMASSTSKNSHHEAILLHTLFELSREELEAFVVTYVKHGSRGRRPK
ncbi:hypothetical protein PanWU01x14_176910, partial [Parasponia andersonii]